MNEFDWVDGWRLVNTALTVLVLVLFTMQTRKIWRVMGKRRKALCVAFIVYLCRDVEGLIETISKDVGGGPRVGLTTIACLVALFAIWYGTFEDEPVQGSPLARGKDDDERAGQRSVSGADRYVPGLGDSGAGRGVLGEPGTLGRDADPGERYRPRAGGGGW